MARNNYNRYAQPYLPPQSGGNLVYQPSFDANSTVNQMLVDDFDKSQQRYDVGRQKFADFKGVVGGMDTYSPDLLQNRLGEFSDDVSGTVQEQYGGDWGLAANDIVEMIADERANPLYKAIDYQNKEVERLKSAQSQKRALGENFIIQNDPRQADLAQLIESGDYHSGLEARYLTTPNYDKLATQLVKDVRPDSFAGLTELNQNERELLTEAIGSGNIDGFLANYKSSGTKGKLNKDQIKEALTNSFIEQASEPLMAEIQAENPNMTPEEVQLEVSNRAGQYIENKIPQLSTQSSSRNVRNFTPKTTEETPVTFGTPITRTRSNIVDGSKTKEYKKTYGSGKVNIDAPYVENKESKKIQEEYGRQKQIFQSNLSNSEQKGRAALNMKKLEEKGALNAENHAKGLKAVNDFESKNGTIFLDNNGLALSPSKKLEAISNIEDAKNTYSDNYLTFNNFYRDEGLVLEDASEMLASGNFNAKSVTDENGNKIEVDGTTLRYSGLLNNKKLEDFETKGINPDNLKIIAEKGNKQIEYYPNDQAQELGQKLEEHNSNLKTQGYSVLSDYGGEPYLVVEKFNRGAVNKTLPYGSYENVAVPIPQELVGSITSKEQAEAYYKALVTQGAQRVSNNSLMVDAANKAGNIFKFSSKIQ